MKKTKIDGTQEWSGISLNFQRGCRNDCLYCYGKRDACRRAITTPDGITPSTWHEESVSITGKKLLVKNSAFSLLPPDKQPYMFPTTHDIFPENLINYKNLLKRALDGGNFVLIVSKPRRECIENICADFTSYRRKMMFRFTIGSSNDDVLKFWEPNAPSFAERLDCLKLAFKKGYKTSVSCEPMLDDNIHAVIEAVEDYVCDFIWLGTMNGIFYKHTKILRDDVKHLEEHRSLLEEIVFTYQSEEAIKGLYSRYARHPKIKWKKSIKEIVGLELQTCPDQDWFHREPPIPVQ
jgi:DNA repair photolyase